MSHGNKGDKTISQTAHVRGLGDDHKIEINLIQEREKPKVRRPCPEVVAYHSQPKIPVVFHNLQDGKEQTDIAFNYGSGPKAPRIHLRPGEVHHLPQCVIDWINGRTHPVYGKVMNPDGKGEYAPGVVGKAKLYMLVPQVPEPQAVTG